MNTLKSVSGGTFAFRVFGGIIGGLAGTVVMLIVQVLAMAFLPVNAEVSGITNFTLVAMILLSTLTANTISAKIVTLTDKTKYQNTNILLIHVLILNLILFIFTAPLYLFSSTEILMLIAAFHLLFSAQMTALLLEVSVGGELPLIATYGTAFGGIAAIAVISFIFLSTNTPNSGISTLLLFIVMPLVWGIIEFFLCLSEIIFAAIYDKFYASKS